MERATHDRALAQLALEIRSKINAFGAKNCHALIACSKTKGSHRDLARNIYESPLYRKSVLAAEGWGMPFSILSAKYGLLHPDDVIEPYELTLKGKTNTFKSEWAERVTTQIHSNLEPQKHLVVLAGDDYLLPLLAAQTNRLPNYFSPMKGLSLGNRLAFLNQCIRLKKRQADIAKIYTLFERMSEHAGGLRELGHLLENDLPKQGVYFFFDANEPTSFSNVTHRLVRIGTHGVSLGSTATLRTRLRTHLGTKSGAGNHRASVFRLHVGRALIERDGLDASFPNWGKGQSAPKGITISEADIEMRVSEYIGKLRVLYVPVSDTSGTTSIRALIERQFIALFTENMCPLEDSSPSWLGRFSDKPAIRKSGLWNIRDVGGEYDLKFADYFESLLNRSIKNLTDA